MSMMISVVIAAYNEEARIVESFFKVRNYLTAQDVDYEIIVVDDGCTDKADDVEIFLRPRKKALRYWRRRSGGSNSPESKVRPKIRYRCFLIL